MELLLWRHAEAEDIHDGMADRERRLTPKGEKQALKMAAWLLPRLPHNTRILVSPAQRTIETARVLERKFELCDLIALGASLSDHLAAICSPNDGTVLIVGHQPLLGQLASFLMCGHAHDWEIRKGAVWWLRAESRESRADAQLRVAMSPKMLD